MSLNAGNKYKIRRMDVKSAYSQGNGFHRDIVVGPPREENDSNRLRNLLVPDCDWTASGQLRYLNSYEVMKKQFGFSQSKLDAFIYKRQRGETTTLIVESQSSFNDN